MQKEEIIKLYNEFATNYDEEAKTSIWKEHSQTFRDFWNNKLLNPDEKEINESEADQIIKILDVHAKGRTKKDESVARVMIPQGVWRRMFKEIKNNNKLCDLLNKIFLENDDNQRTILIDELYRINEGKKNSLTGKSGNAINAFLCAFNPTKNISVVSLNDGIKVIGYFNFIDISDFDNATQGKKIVLSNRVIMDGFRSLGINATPRTISVFLYASDIKDYWKPDKEDGTTSGGKSGQTRGVTQETSDIELFYMESQLEDFLIENWDKTELGNKYDLIEENGEIVSQQYKTDIGKIDILVQDKKTKQYVVIELKKNQTSDDTVGQLARYMGWLEECKTGGELTKGIIIAARYDNRLYYALKKVKDAEVYLYRVNFNLEEFKKP